MNSALQISQQITLIQKTTNYDTTQNVIAFCSARLVPEVVSPIIKKHRGLDEPNLDEDLKKSSYIPVLKAIWSERDRVRRLNWLREKAQELHAFVLYELGLAEFKVNPTSQTANEISYPLFEAASIRFRQDILCATENLYDQFSIIDGIYGKALFELMKKEMGTDKFHETLFSSKNFNYFKRIKVREITEKSLKIPLPSPIWVSSISNLQPKEYWNIIRFNFATKVLKDLDQALPD